MNLFDAFHDELEKIAAGFGFNRFLQMAGPILKEEAQVAASRLGRPVRDVRRAARAVKNKALGVKPKKTKVVENFGIDDPSLPKEVREMMMRRLNKKQ